MQFGTDWFIDRKTVPGCLDDRYCMF